jgi:hypothetical protein
MKYLILVFTLIMCQVSFATQIKKKGQQKRLAQAQVEKKEESIDWLKNLRIRFGYENLATDIKMDSAKANSVFYGLALGVSYSFDSFYTGLEYVQIKNQSALKLGQFKAFGGYEFSSLNLPVTPYIEGSYGMGSMEESGGTYKISDQKGRVWGLEVGGQYKLKNLSSSLDHLTVSIGYKIQNQTHSSSEKFENSVFDQKGLKLSIFYNF